MSKGDDMGQQTRPYWDRRHEIAESIANKATRLIAEDKITQAGSLYTVQGDHGTYYVTVEGTGWDARTRCDCPATGYCSHADAVYRLINRDSDPFEGLT